VTFLPGGDSEDEEMTNDAARNVKLNPVHLPDGQVVSWAEAFPTKHAVSLRTAPPPPDEKVHPGTT
jgi:hypothetical protein